MPKHLENLHILCYRWGDRYGVDYVNKLCRMVNRHLAVPHIFHCVTDCRHGLLPQIEVHDLPNIGVAGNWNKLQTFKKNFLGLQGQYVVCMDLDLVIVDSLDFLAERAEAPFLIAKNWAKGVRGNSSVYRLKVGALTKIWEDFISDPEFVIDRFHGKTRLGGDQRWMNHNIQHYDFFPAEKIVSFKRHCRAKSRSLHIPLFGEVSLASIGAARLPKGAAVVAFTGNPLPPDVVDKPWGRWRRAPFVAEHWQ